MHRNSSRTRLAGWLTFAVLLWILAGGPGQIAPAQKTDPPGFKIGVRVQMVSLDVSVLDPAGRPVRDLQASQFSVLDEDLPREIIRFEPADLPITVGLVVDTSGSMRNRLDLISRFVSAFLHESNPENELFIVDFSHDRAELLLNFTRDQDEVRDALKERMLAGGGTPLWDSMYLSMDHIRDGKYDRKVILVISDGEDKDSYYQFQDLAKKAQQSDWQLYFVALQDTRNDSLFDLSSSARDMARQQVETLSVNSGGRSFFPENVNELTDIAKNIAQDLRNQYRIGFRPPENAKTGYRRVAVRLEKNPEMKIRTRKGYFWESKKR